MSQPFVSFIITSYNQAEYLQETLNSIVNQKGDISYEMIIIDDCSKDGSPDIIKQWIEIEKPENCTLILNDNNLGLCKTLNKAISVSKGEWVKYIACDDILESDYLIEVKKYIDNGKEEVAFICTDMSHINSKGEMYRTSNWEYGHVEIDEESVNDFNKLLKAQYLNTPTVIYKKSLWEEIGGYDENLIFEDWDLYLRAKKVAKFGVIKKSLVRYRLHESNMHMNFKTNERYVTDSIVMLKKHLEEQTKPIIREGVIKEIANLIPINENRAIEIWSKEYDWLKLEKNGAMPLVSVLMPAYNAAQYIENAINSVLLQTYPNLELVIVNDGSTDATVDRIASCMVDKRIRLINFKENVGLAKCLNIGLDNCTGDFVARMDATDLIKADRIEKQIDFLEKHTDCSAVSSWMCTFDEKGNSKVVKFRSHIDDIKASLLFFSPIPHPATTFRANIIKEYGYKEEFFLGEDYDLWFRLLQKHRIGMMTQVFHYYRIHSNQYSAPKDLSLSFESHSLILKNICNYFKIDLSEDEIEFHVNYCRNMGLETKVDFMKWDMHLRFFLNRKTSYFKDTLFKDFVFKNFWLKSFFALSPSMNRTERFKLLTSPFCKLSLLTKVKKIFLG
jgi:glycosyltransferase involved in cell wall biosynthesis